ncbi:hypothetical protein L0P92_44610, partial [Streptomyces muensis]|nr:hypothetical protein [Streptomyces muensis]
MSVEHDDDRFEGRLSHALHDIGGGFDADRPALVAAGRARGRPAPHPRRRGAARARAAAPPLRPRPAPHDPATQRPFNDALSPEILTGVDCRLPASN